MADPQLPVNTVSLAYRGQKINLEDYPARKSLPRSETYQQENQVQARHIDYEPVTIDFTDLAKLSTEIAKLSIRLHQTRIDYRKAKRMALHYKWQYNTAKSRVMIQLSGGSEKLREAMAEIMCEDEYSTFLVAQTVADELKELNYAMRVELDALRELCNNLRREMSLM